MIDKNKVDIRNKVRDFDFSLEENTIEKLEVLLELKGIHFFEYQHLSGMNTLNNQKNLFLNEDLSNQKKINLIVTSLIHFFKHDKKR